MKVILFVAIAVVIIITNLALCKSSKRGDKMLEHPERITLRGNRP